jgi:hypothetical protein
MAKGGQKDHSGMNKETYDRHYTANKYVGGHHGSPAHMKGSQSDHGQSSKEFADHEARVGTDGHGSAAKMVSPLNSEGGIDKHGHIMNAGGGGKISSAERWARHQKGAPHHGGKPGGDKKHGSAAKMVSPVKQVMDPSLAQQPQSLMSNVPPQQANTMGQAQPVFSPQTQQVAQGMFGSTQSMQNSVGATPLFQVQELPAVDLGTVKSDYKDKAFGLPFPGDKMYKGTDGFGKYGGKYTKEMTDANSNYTRQHNLANKPGYAEMKQNQLQEETSVVKTEDEGMSNMLQRQENERRSIMEQTELSDRTELSED